MKSPISSAKLILTGLAAYCLLSSPLSDVAHRGIASCVDPVESSLFFPEQMFAQVQDEALRQSAMQFYLFLSQVEANAISGRQAVRSAYGIVDTKVSSAALYAPPKVVNYDFGGSSSSSNGGQLWGNIGSLGMNKPTANFSLSALGNVAPASVGKNIAMPGIVTTAKNPPPTSLTGKGKPSNLSVRNGSAVAIGSAAP